MLGVFFALAWENCQLLVGITQGSYAVWETMKWEMNEESDEKEFIRWMEFTPTKEALQTAYDWDVETVSDAIHIDWITLLAYGAVKGGGKFDKKVIRAMNEYAEAVRSGEKDMEELEEMKYYPYYHEILSAVLDGMVGNYRIEVSDDEGNVTWQDCYGLKAFSPIAKGFYYNDYDDFGTGRSYGYKRRHLGHDMMGQIGTPIIAVESGYVEALGWNQYGGWRIGIRSLDKKRYYYYAHLRQNYPYAEGLEEGSYVTAGDVIGYMGHTGYSATENVNNIDVTHLHFGMEIIFDESQKDSDNEIWIDCYELTKFLYQNQSAVEKIGDTREWKRVYDMEDTVLDSMPDSMPDSMRDSANDSVSNSN